MRQYTSPEEIDAQLQAEKQKANVSTCLSLQCSVCCLASGFWGEQERTTVLQETSHMRMGRTPDGKCEPWSRQSQSQRGGPMAGPTRRDFAHFAVAALVVSTRGPVACLLEVLSLPAAVGL